MEALLEGARQTLHQKSLSGHAAAPRAKKAHEASFISKSKRNSQVDISMSKRSIDTDWILPLDVKKDDSFFTNEFS